MVANLQNDGYFLKSSRVRLLFYQVLVTLRYLAKGDFLSEVADIHGISRSSASRIIPRVCRSIIKNFPIRYPTDPQATTNMKTKFYRIANFPNVIGCIDGVLIGIQTPYQDEASYVCRKGFHALNVQAIADAEMKFINVVIRWPGSTHDSFILTNSNISNELERRNNGWLLGDSGYALKNWLMTPFMYPVNIQQKRYNSAHARTRNIVERSFGVLKSRFRCLDRSGSHLSYQPKKAVHIIGACFSLHNFATEKKMPVPNHDDDDNHDDENSVAMQQPAGRAQEIRNHTASRF